MQKAQNQTVGALPLFSLAFFELLPLPWWLIPTPRYVLHDPVPPARQLPKML